MKSFIVCILAICAVFAVVESKKFELKSRIVGGDFAVDGQFPYQVSLRQTRTRSHHCGASIISPRFLLTAAHCVQGGAADPKNLYAVVGTILPSEKGTAYPLDRIIPHEEYGPTAITNDIAFLRTAKTIVFNEFVQPIALPTRNTPADLPAYISGWGVTKTHGPGTKYMKYAKTHTISQKQCYDLHKKFRMEHRIVETSLCAFEQNGDGVCNGDSGEYDFFLK